MSILTGSPKTRKHTHRHTRAHTRRDVAEERGLPTAHPRAEEGRCRGWQRQRGCREGRCAGRRPCCRGAQEGGNCAPAEEEVSAREGASFWRIAAHPVTREIKERLQERAAEQAALAEKYRDRAAERRKGITSEYTQHDDLLTSIKKPCVQPTHEAQSMPRSPTHSHTLTRARTQGGGER